MQQRRPLWAWAALALLLVVGGVTIIVLTRGTTLWVDEWTWVLERRSGSLLEPHNRHLSLVPLVIYRALFEGFGVDRSLPYRAVLVVCHLGVVTLLFVYARRRVDDWVALALALALLAFGPAWQDILWPFQVGWLIPLACGVSAFVLLDRRDRVGDVGASVLVAVALASSGIGAPIAVGVAVDLALTRRTWRSAPIVLVPLAFYALWWLTYQDGGDLRTWTAAVGFAADSAGSVLASLLGLTGTHGPGPGDRPALGWGRPLLLGALVLLAWRRPLPGRAIALLSVPVAFWLATGIERSYISVPETSRYLYVGALFVLLAVAELAAGRTVPRRWVPVAAVVLLAAVFSNVGALRQAAADLRRDAADTRAILAVVDLDPSLFADAEVLDQIPGSPFTRVQVGPYRAATRAVGTPADSLPDLIAAPQPARVTADQELAEAVVAQMRAGARGGGATAPVVERVDRARAQPRGGCVGLASPRAGASLAGTAELTVPKAGLTVTAAGGDVALTLRRFGDTYGEDPQARVRAGSTGILRLPADGAPQPWHARVAPGGSAIVCSL